MAIQTGGLGVVRWLAAGTPRVDWRKVYLAPLIERFYRTLVELVVTKWRLYPLVEGFGADWTDIGLLSSVNSLVFAESAAVTERLPAVPAPIRPLSCMDPQVNLKQQQPSHKLILSNQYLYAKILSTQMFYLVRRSWIERFPALKAREHPGYVHSMNCLPMTQQTLPIFECLATLATSHRCCCSFIFVQYHVPTMKTDNAYFSKKKLNNPEVTERYKN